MAFLDNSGDIILDAVLTDLGRKRMSEGNFRITQFALGDDEVDYSLYNKNHPSGSAYYDLEILQTPVFEAFTRTNANVNYGLASYNGNQNLLYLPSMKLNTKTGLGVNNGQLRPTTGGVVYFAVNQDVADVLKLPGALGTATNYLQDGVGSRGLLIETGLDTQGSDAIIGNLRTRGTYIVNNSLEDTELIVKADSRIFSGIRYPNLGTAGGGASFDFNILVDSDGKKSINVSINLINSANLVTGNQEIDNYEMAVLPTKPNLVSRPSDGTTIDTDLSVINGPRAQVAAASFSLTTEIAGGTRDALYSLLGKIDQDLFGDGNTYDYIDTLVYFVGNVTGVTLQVPIRVIRKV
jgi:hypothetical protein